MVRPLPGGANKCNNPRITSRIFIRGTLMRFRIGAALLSALVVCGLSVIPTSSASAGDQAASEDGGTGGGSGTTAPPDSTNGTGTGGGAGGTQK